MQIPAQVALNKIKGSQFSFLELFRHGTLAIEIYKPIEVDKQLAHDRDEVYIVIAGNGDFIIGDGRTKFQAGDFLFVPAGVTHRFENFSTDFSTWVIFYGPVGGEINHK